MTLNQMALSSAMWYP